MEKKVHNRIADSAFKDTSKHWGDVIADKVLEVFPNLEVYTCAAGISPSGTVHFGNFRDVITAYVVSEALKRRGKNSRVLFSWDNYDRFRKVPANVDMSFVKYVGMPLSKIPDPWETASSYAEHFQAPFESAMEELEITLDYKNQSEKYERGEYVDDVIEAMKKRKDIARIQLSFMTEKSKTEKEINEEDFIENYYPISVYSRFTGKDSTKITSYDNDATVVYECEETGKTDTIDLRKDFCVKLVWKADWPMRWRKEGVVFEPGGHDHASPGSSYDVSSTISKEVFGYEPPVFAGYLFVGIQGLGTKMSGSTGDAVSPSELLQIYETYLLKWLYLRKTPAQAFQLAFNSEVYRQYDESDREIEKLKKSELEEYDKTSLELSLGGHDPYENPIPFKQAVALGQILDWDVAKVLKISHELGVEYDQRSLEARLQKAHAWLFTFNKEEAITLLKEPNIKYWETMDEKSRKHTKELARGLKEKTNIEIKELEEFVYAIPKDPKLSQKENVPLQRAFFKDVYMLLIGKETGPRLSTFLWALTREKVLNLLNL